MKHKHSVSSILDRLTPEEEDWASWAVAFTWGCAMALQDLLIYIFGGWASIAPWLVILGGALGCAYNNYYAPSSDTNGEGPHS